MTRIVYGSANARDLRSLCGAIQNLPQISDLLVDCKSVYLKYIYKSIDKLEDIHSLIDSAIVEEPPFTVREGGMIKRGYNEELDSVTGDMNDSKGILARIEAEQRDITGIPKLKVGYNRVFGYYIEVSNSYKSMVPETYIRKQTLTNCERYITQDLKDVEAESSVQKTDRLHLNTTSLTMSERRFRIILKEFRKPQKPLLILMLLHHLQMLRLTTDT